MEGCEAGKENGGGHGMSSFLIDEASVMVLSDKGCVGACEDDDVVHYQMYVLMKRRAWVGFCVGGLREWVVLLGAGRNV